MRGKPRTEEERIKAIELLTTMSAVEVSKLLNIPTNTLIDWKNGNTKSSKAHAEEFVLLRAKKKEEFVERGWAIIEGAQSLLGDLVEADKARPVEERKLRAQDITNIMGVQYDKQALANNESTANLGGSITIETLVKKVEGEEY